MAIKYRITICKTVGEWKIIENKIKEINKAGVRSYINNNISTLKNTYLDCPDCITCGGGNKKSKQFAVRPEVYKVLMEISEIMDRPISSIIDDFYITPLLNPKQSA